MFSSIYAFFFTKELTVLHYALPLAITIRFLDRPSSNKKSFEKLTQLIYRMSHGYSSKTKIILRTILDYNSDGTSKLVMAFLPLVYGTAGYKQ